MNDKDIKSGSVKGSLNKEKIVTALYAIEDNNLNTQQLIFSVLEGHYDMSENSEIIKIVKDLKATFEVMERIQKYLKTTCHQQQKIDRNEVALRVLCAIANRPIEMNAVNTMHGNVSTGIAYTDYKQSIADSLTIADEFLKQAGVGE